MLQPRIMFHSLWQAKIRLFLISAKARVMESIGADLRQTSRRHIKGSKIAKGLQNVKLLVNWGPFMEKSDKKSHNAEKN